MKASSSPEVFGLILDGFYAGDMKPIAKVNYLGDDYRWHELEDVQNVSIAKKSVDNRWNAFSLIPPVATMNVSMSNAAQKYDDGSGSALEGILTRNRKLRAYIGYQVKTLETNYNAIDFEVDAGSYFNTKLSGGLLVTDILGNGSAADVADLGWTLYDGSYYDAGEYAGEGSYITKVFGLEELKSLKIQADTAAVAVYTRSGSSGRSILSAAWAYAGNTIAGPEKVFSVTHPARHKYYQIRLVWSTGEWGAGAVSSVKIGARYINEYYPQGIYLADDPGFESTKNGYYASFPARANMKKALETKISIRNLVSVDIMEIVRQSCRKSGVPYSAGSLPDIGLIVSIPATQPFLNVAAQTVLDECMTYIAGMTGSNYRLYETDAGELALEERNLSAANADMGIHYQDNILSASKKKSSNNLLQRATVASKAASPSDMVALADVTLTAAGDHVVTLAYEAIYKDIEIYYQGSAAGIEASIIDSELATVTIRVTGSGTVSVRVYVEGARFTGARPYCGEIFASINHVIPHGEQGVSGEMQRREGITKQFVNRFVDSDANAKALAGSMVSEYGNKKYQLSITTWGMPWAEVGDRHTVFERYASTNSIFVVDDVSVTYAAKGAVLRSTIAYSDLGFFLENYIWDRNGRLEGDLDIFLDRGMVFDQDMIGEDPETYENTREVKFS